MTPIQRIQAWHIHLPHWLQDWLGVMVPALQIVLIILGAWLLQRLFRRILRRTSTHYQFPLDLLKPINTVVRWVLVSGATLLALERLGVSATVLWSAFTGFAAVGAVAFFAAWSVLSNLFCAFLILTVRPFRIGDHIEVLDIAEKPGALGQVVDINLLFTTLQDITEEHRGAMLQIPNTLVFQRIVRRWRAGTPVPATKLSTPSAVVATPPAPEAATTPSAALPAPQGPTFP